MKITLTILLIFLLAAAQAQSFIKQPSLGIHYALTDFATAEKIKATSLSNVLKNKLWSKPMQMMTGFGVDFLTGINNHIDFAATVNYTHGTDAFNLPSTNITSYSLITVDALLHIKLMSDKYYVRPFLAAGVGLYNQNGTGLYAPLGVGVQFNVFNAAIVNAQAQYRLPFKNTDNPAFIYEIGFAVPLKGKKPPPSKVVPVEQPAVVKVEEKPVEEIKPVYKNIAVTVFDVSTGLPLPNVDVSITGADNKLFNATTNNDGKVMFSSTPASAYAITGSLNNISTTGATLSRADFDTGVSILKITLTHNDPRFTLVGRVVNKNGGAPVSGTIVTITNTITNAPAAATGGIDGKFSAQLEAGSDFTVVGKKAGYISNIEAVSTKGLNRSATLYVQLELGIEEVKAGQAIVLNKIYFETGKTTLNTAASGDLERLVQFLQDNPAVQLEISGFTDNVGTRAKNNMLSLGRANSVVIFLVSKGIAQSRLSAKGYGPLSPIAGNTTAEGRAQNRRVEMKVIEPAPK